MRLVTHGELDGLAVAVLISAMAEIAEILLMHPQDITDKRWTHLLEQGCPSAR
jgi:hypothetical protein